MDFKVKKRGPLAARARRWAYFATGIASMWCFISLFNLLQLTSLVGMSLSTFYLSSWLMLGVNVVALVGSWRGRHAPQWGARAALLGGVGMLALGPLTMLGLPGFWLWLPFMLVGGSLYALPYFAVAGLQWHVYRLMQQAGVTPHEAAYADASRLALADEEEDSSNASDDTLEPPQQQHLV